MDFIPVDPKEVAAIRKGKTNILHDLLRFIDSKHEVVQLSYTGKEYVTIASMYGTYNRAIKRYGLTNVKCILRGDRAYLIKLKENTND